MKVTNNSDSARALSHDGKEHTLLPGQSVDVALTADEAEALSAIFEVSGKPTDEAKTEKKVAKK